MNFLWAHNKQKDISVGDFFMCEKKKKKKRKSSFASVKFDGFIYLSSFPFDTA